eukprot:5407690-Ditylum_brightwellii.AAC.1
MLTQPDQLANQHKNLNWPEQGLPNKQTWELWKKALSTLFCYNNDKLKQPLGKWLCTYKRWNAYYNSKTDKAIVYSNRWTKHKIIQRTRQHMTISVLGPGVEKPDLDAHYMFPITDLIQKGNTLQFTHPVNYRTKQKGRRPDTFKQYIKHLPAWERQLLKHWKHITDDEDLKTQILLHKIFYYVTDGGVDDGIGYF